MADEVIVIPTPVNPVVVKGAIAFSAEHARIWAEGSDEEVEKLGGEHSAKGWADASEQASHDYTDEQIALAKQELTNSMNIAVDGAVNTAKSYTDNEVNEETLARQQAVSGEAETRALADNNLQSQIDALSAASDVKDIVGTYAELQAYDTSTLGDNDIIKVLDDSTHGDAPSYYRWDATDQQFEYIGSESASYTKAEADAKFLTQTDAASTYVNNTALATALATKASSADGVTITDNGSAISTVAVKEQRASTAIKQWVGTKAQYTAIDTKDPNTVYVITDETDVEAITVDSALSATSEHPVQNKVITNALQNIDALPSQSGNSGKFLTTDGTTASWATVSSGDSIAAGDGIQITTQNNTKTISNAYATSSTVGGVRISIDANNVVTISTSD